jgi:hypothetical protein
MSNPSVVSLQLVAAVANGICQSQAVAAAGALTLNGSLVSGGVATMDVARRVLFASAGADSAVVFTITGTNQSGAPISETLKGVASGSSQYTALDYLTVTSITSSAATAGNITVGTNGVASTPWVLDNFLSRDWALTVWVTVVSGAATYTVEDTPDDPNATQPIADNYSLEPASFNPPGVWANPSMTAQTTNQRTNYLGQPIFAHRLTITAGTGKVVMQSIQSGID